MPVRPPALPSRPPSLRRPATPVADVTAVLVAHDGERWLPTALEALARQTVQPAQVLLVDTGSRDATAELLAAAGPVLTLPRDTGYGAAVGAALASAPADTSWLWLLHDDVAPEPEALEALLAHAAGAPAAAVLGPKMLDWDDPRVLVEVGVTTDAAGHRETGLERREQDQGQHDAPRDVLAVGTAAALVRRDVWQALGGLDRALEVFRDDLDLGWRVNAAGARVVVVPAARARHARAATTGRRSLDAAGGRPAGIDRRNALLVLLAHASAPRLALMLPGLVAASVLRALGFLLTRQVLLARDELAAPLSVLGRPGRLLAARRERARTRTVRQRELRPLFATRTARLQTRLAAASGWVSGDVSPGAPPAPGDVGAPEAEELAAPVRSGALRRLLLRRGVLLVLALALLALVAERSVLAVGGGVLAGGRLLPPPDGAGELWAAYAGSWSPTAGGTAAPPPPSLAVLAALASVLLGKAWLAVDLLLLASVPLAGATAWWAARHVVGSPLLAAWAAVTWALLPVATGAVATGRLDAAAVQMGLPLLAVGAAAVLRGDPRASGWHRAWALGLGLALVSAFSPALWPLAATLLVGAAVVMLGSERGPAARRRAVAAAVAAVVPGLVLLPWSLSAVRSLGLLLHGPGRLAADAALVDPTLPAWHLLLLSPGGAGVPPVWMTAGLVLAALGGLLRSERSRPAVAGWAVVLASLAVGALLSRTPLPGPGTTLDLPVWPGVALQLAAGGMLLAALVGADCVGAWLAHHAVGWRHLLVGVTAVTAGLVPLLAAGAWVVGGAADPLRRDIPPLLPAFARAELEQEPGLRVLAVRPGAGGTAAYELTGARGDRLGRGDVPVPREQLAALDDVVADLLSPRGSAAAEALATRAVRYVALPGGDGTALRGLAAALDSQQGLTRRSVGDVLLWQVTAPTGRLTLLPPATAAAATSGDDAVRPDRELLRDAPPVVLPSGREAAVAAVPPGEPGRLAVLAEAADPGWQARLDGRPLPRRTAWGWAQGFEVPPEGGRLELRRDAAPRRLALAGQAATVLVVAVLAAPAARRRRGLEVVDDREDDAAAGAPA
jgi:GT2 family glycosyltransferase